MSSQAKKSNYCYLPVNPYPHQPAPGGGEEPDPGHHGRHGAAAGHTPVQKSGAQPAAPRRTCCFKFSRMRRPPRRKASSSSSYAHKQCAEHIACVHLPSCHHHQVSKGQEGSPHLLRLTSHSPKTLPSLSGPPSPPLIAGEGSGPS